MDSINVNGAALEYEVRGAGEPVLLIDMLVLFPDGRLLSRRWRWVAGVAIVSFAFTIGLKLFDPEPYPPPNPIQKPSRVWAFCAARLPPCIRVRTIRASVAGTRRRVE